jgi:hypothetical protein
VSEQVDAYAFVRESIAAGAADGMRVRSAAATTVEYVNVELDAYHAAHEKRSTKTPTTFLVTV